MQKFINDSPVREKYLVVVTYANNTHVYDHNNNKKIKWNGLYDNNRRII